MENRDQAGNPIPGFAPEGADEINGNYLQVPARWGAEVIGKLRRAEGDPEVNALAGLPVRLHFVMRDARLESSQFVP